jgi:hypothetical protein
VGEPSESAAPGQVRVLPPEERRESSPEDGVPLEEAAPER